MSRLERILLAVNILIYTFLFIFSYAYVDLNLTISQNPQVLRFITLMQQLGYYNRPIATIIYSLFLIVAFLFFVLNLWLFYKSKIGKSYLKFATLANTAVLIFAYPYLSADLFNYLFDAKIILKYHSLPYTHRPLDFPNDEWLRFMRWVHRFSPYGPLWLGVSLIPAILGLGKFILNFLAFKIFIGAFHLLNSYLIFNILKKIDAKKALLGTAFYALNPLLLIEGIANAHNDIVLASSLILTIYFFVKRETVKSYLAIFAGVLVKYIPLLVLPWFIIGGVNYKKVILLSLASMTIFTFIFSTFPIKVPFVPGGSTQVQFQPWYLFWTLPYIALLPVWPLIILGLSISLGASIRYLPFLFYGDWSHHNTILFMQTVTILPLILGLFAVIFKKLQKNIK